ncbi:MAG: hypothetical protein ACT4PI_13995 [Actinomycetota bacterium]
MTDRLAVGRIRGSAAVATGPSHLADARTAIADITPSFVRLVRESAADGPAVGRWGIGDVACHVGHVITADTASLAGQPPPTSELPPAAVLTDAMLADDPERDLAILADRIDALLADFLAVSDAPASEQVTWLGGIRLPASAVACHLLEELLVHGFDMATATNSVWTIAPEHAALALVGAAAPIVKAAGPTAFVDPERAQGFRARFDVRLRGYQRLTFVFDNGMTIDDDTSGPIDAHVSADPVSMLLLMLRRVSAGRAILGGKITVWGWRPWRLRRMLTVLTPP